MPMAITSLLAHEELKRDGKITNQEHIVLDHLETPRNSREISLYAGMERTSVCGRLNSLEHKGYIVKHEIIKCPITKKKTWTYRRLS